MKRLLVNAGLLAIFLFSAGALYWTREEWTSEKLFYDLAVGTLVSLFFYLLVVRLPDYERRQRLKSSLERHYEAFREDCIEIMLQVGSLEKTPRRL